MVSSSLAHSENCRVCVCVFLFSAQEKTPAVKSESPASLKKAENLRGCDLLQELSVTIRRFKKTSVAKERSERCYRGAALGAVGRSTEDRHRCTQQVLLLKKAQKPQNNWIHQHTQVLEFCPLTVSTPHLHPLTWRST